MPDMRLPENMPVYLCGEALKMAKKSYESVMEQLDPHQRAAARVSDNSVIAAGAGSGKTRVLAARYLYLVIERGIPVDEIVALTFTRKAASEMYSRIYASLREVDHPLAEEAVNAFHLARIDTIDAFCNSIARNACRKYGISPDFKIDNDRATEIAANLALPFFLERRKSPAIQQLMKRYALAELPGRLLANTVIRYSTVSAPLDFTSFLKIQSDEIAVRFAETTKKIVTGMNRLASLSGTGGSTGMKVAKALETVPGMPDSGNAEEIASFIKTCDGLAGISLPGKVSDPSLVELKETLSDFKKNLYPEFLSIANWVLNRPFVEETFSLLADFQEIFNRKKREAGVLTFADVSRLALDALVSDPDLRSAYKSSTSAIMIDEFQDDNAMQRDLLFLIAEKLECRELSVPRPDELCPDKLFFVGDEKQSIYRFRGADVAVFRRLARDIVPHDPGLREAAPDLGINYRTESRLIESFNAIFPSVFLNPAFYRESDFPIYEAVFSPIKASRTTDGLMPAMDILLVNESNFIKGDHRYLSPSETEASEVASRIRNLLDSGYPVRTDDGVRPCTSDDIAILFRSGTRQHLYEKYLRENGIPSQCESLRGLFSDAPINDLYAILRLAVYPADNTAYATVLRSPFVCVSDIGFAAAVLDRTCRQPMSEPFAETAEAVLEAEDALRFARGRKLFASLQEMADRVPASEIISWLWYEAGYRYALLLEPQLHRYAELYDYFFELARLADGRGETLATFLDEIQRLMSSGEKIDGLDIPAERSGGVRIMTVHKSKGLEFPVVFLVDSGNEGRGNRNDEPVYYSEATGLSVNTGVSEEAAAASANYFYEKGREEEKNREQAEVRRLLYVAMTRAETRLFISGTISGEGESISAILSGILEKKDSNAEKKGTPIVKKSFIDFLLPSLSSGELPGITISEIPPALQNQGTVKIQDQSFSQDELTALYESAPLASYAPPVRTRFSATALHSLSATAAIGTFPAGATVAASTTVSSTATTAAADNTPSPAATQLSAVAPTVPAAHTVTAEDSTPPDSLDLLLKKTGISPNDFGTFAHRAIEERFTGIRGFMNEELRPIITVMTDRFFLSELGKMSLKADWRECEYGFITRYPFEGARLTVTGQIDLVFEYEGKIYIIDYKTDRVENPEIHAEQLAVYRKAIGDLRKKPPETWIFYLRSGNAVQVH